MKKLYYVATNGYDMLVSVDDFQDYNDVEDWLGIDYYKPDTPRIIAQIDTDSI